MTQLPMLCLSVAVEAWSGVELKLAGLAHYYYQYSFSGRSISNEIGCTSSYFNSLIVSSLGSKYHVVVV